MGLFAKTKGKEELVLVFSIGSSEVIGALVKTRKCGNPKIVFFVKEQMPVEKTIDTERFLLSVKKALEPVVRKIYEAKLGVPSKIFCVLSSFLCVSQTRKISLKKNTPFIFTEKIANDLIQKEVKIFEEENAAKYKSKKSSLRVIELKSIKTTLNGYETSNPLDQKAQELEMTVFVTIAGERVLGEIESIIQKHFYNEKIRFSSFTLSSFTAVRDLYPKQEDFLLVDMGGELTSIFMVKKNILCESFSFPLGCNFLIRGVSSSLGCSLDEASSYISLLKEKHANESVIKKLAPILVKLKKQWLVKFQESLINISNDISLPPNVYVILVKDLADFFLDAIKSEQFSQYTLTESKFNVIFLNPDLLRENLSFERGYSCEPIIMIDVIYVNRFLINHD